MNAKPLYVFRNQDQLFLDTFSASLEKQNGQDRPFVFHVYGVGGVGKTYLLKRIQKSFSSQACVLYTSFDSKIGIETPIQLMKKLYEELGMYAPKPNILHKELFPKPDSFCLKINQYESVLTQLEMQPVEGKSSVDSDQIKIVKQLVKQTSSFASSFFIPGSLPNEIHTLVSDLVVDSSSMLLSEKDRIQQFLQRHQATKKNKQLQKLLQSPLSELTHAFIQVLVKKSKNYPIVLALDTYEKAGTDFDIWALYFLLRNSFLTRLKHNIFVIISSRLSLMEKKGWRKLQQDSEMIYSTRLSRFNLEQTQHYLSQVNTLDKSKINTIFQTTKGLPYYLKWVKDELILGRKIDFSIGNEIVASLILDSHYSKSQKKIIQIAACCRWFNREMLVEITRYFEIPLFIKDEKELDSFNWIKDQSFVEFSEKSYRLNDVARDILRRSLWQESQKDFRDIHMAISAYLKSQAEKIIDTKSEDISDSFEDDDWCKLIAESLYYLVFCHTKEVYKIYIEFWIGTCYFKQDELFLNVINSIYVENRTNAYLLPQKIHLFLDEIKLIYEPVSAILKDNVFDIKDYLSFRSVALKKYEIYELLSKHLFSKFDQVEDLIGVLLLFIELRFCTSSRKDSAIRQLDETMSRLEKKVDKSLVNRLYRDGIGTFCYKSELMEQSIQFYSKALQIKADDILSLNNLGCVISEFLGDHEVAINYLNQAIEIDPDNKLAWFNRGYISAKLQRHEDALISFEKAIINDEENDKAWKSWFNRGNSLRHLMQYEEALDSYNKAILTNSECCDIWNNQGLTLVALKDYELAIESYEKAISIEPRNPLPYYNKACCYALKGEVDLALQSLEKAVALGAQKIKDALTVDRDLDNIRNEPKFLEIYQSLNCEYFNDVS
ncbi:MAG: tetratricopeptide repeat protein [Cyanobacteria bacterium P01_F01_bin.150]